MKILRIYQTVMKFFKNHTISDNLLLSELSYGLKYVEYHFNKALYNNCVI